MQNPRFKSFKKMLRSNTELECMCSYFVDIIDFIATDLDKPDITLYASTNSIINGFLSADYYYEV